MCSIQYYEFSKSLGPPFNVFPLLPPRAHHPNLTRRHLLGRILSFEQQHISSSHSPITIPNRRRSSISNLTVAAIMLADARPPAFGRQPYMQLLQVALLLIMDTIMMATSTTSCPHNCCHISDVLQHTAPLSWKSSVLFCSRVILSVSLSPSPSLPTTTIISTWLEVEWDGDDDDESC